MFCGKTFIFKIAGVHCSLDRSEKSTKASNNCTDFPNGRFTRSTFWIHLLLSTVSTQKCRFASNSLNLSNNWLLKLDRADRPLRSLDS